MKRTLISLAASLGCLILTSSALVAQSSTLSYDIPFAFNALGVEMPAGHYAVVAQSSSTGVLRGPSRGICFLRTSQLSAKPREAHLTFHKYGDAYFLSEVWEAAGRGSVIPKSTREREIQRTEQLSRIQPQTVVLAAAN